MKTDIEIAQETKMLPITTVASQYGITEDDLELYGKYKAKISNELWQEIKDRPDGKLVLVTAINPTPAGEGKTTTSIGLAQAMAKCGKKAMLALREPSLGPCFGIKGGAAGGGYAQVVPMEDLTFILPVISMRSQRQTTFWLLSWTTTSSREMHLGSTRDRSYGRDAWT